MTSRDTDWQEKGYAYIFISFYTNYLLYFSLIPSVDIAVAIAFFLGSERKGSCHDHSVFDGVLSLFFPEAFLEAWCVLANPVRKFLGPRL